MCWDSPAHPQICSLPFSFLHPAAGGNCMSVSAPLLFGFWLGLANRELHKRLGAGDGIGEFLSLLPLLWQHWSVPPKLTAPSRLTSLYNSLWILVIMPPLPLQNWGSCGLWLLSWAPALFLVVSLPSPHLLKRISFLKLTSNYPV